MSLTNEFTLGCLIAVAVLVGGSVFLFTYIKLCIFALFVLLAVKHRRRIYVIIVTLPRDARFVYRFGKVILKLRRCERDNATVLDFFTRRAASDPNKPCIIFQERIWTNGEIDRFSNQVAQVFLSAGYGKGDVVALYMGNRPEYVCIWLGLAKIGVISALINTNLRSQPLQHSLSVAGIKGIIFSQELAPAIQELNLEGKDQYQFEGDISEFVGVKCLTRLMESVPAVPPKVPAPGYRDKLMYIYTSGTTGLPKAAIILHSRYLLVAAAAVDGLALRKDDIIYNCLPLYHMAGGVVGISPALAYGLPCVLRTKFSASAFWSDCIKYNCTVAQYIGEMCRYLLAVPPKPEDFSHRVRIMLGNGIRPNIWEKFMDRFKIEQICELYGATEGNTNIVNMDNTIGAVGFLPRLVPLSFFPLALIRIDNETGEPIRNEKGLCIRCDVDEPGMCIGIINTRNSLSEFRGYLDPEASKKKIIQNVFKHGDQAFMSGDILVMDEFGYLYFKDRTGDTFRWKGENVATTEVEEALTSLIQVKDVAVYGVQVPGTEGRAGMAAIEDPANTLDFKFLAEGLRKTLPPYARPVFIRVMKELELTGTYKIKKTELQKEGFDPTVIKDKVYFSQGNNYIPLTANMYKDILSGAVRL